MIMPLKQFENKKKELRSIKPLKIYSYQLCLYISTVVAFGSERLIRLQSRFGSESANPVFNWHK